MNPLLFHRIAAERGDGLLPEFVALFEQQAAMGEDRPGEIEPAPHQPDCLQEAGPSLVPTDYPGFAENVFRFPSIARDDAPLIGEPVE